MHNRHIQDIIASRRALLQGFVGLPLLSLGACATTATASQSGADLSFVGVAPTNADQVTVPPGYRADVLIAWGEPLFDGVGRFDPDALTRAEQEKRFGTHNDMLALFPADYAFPPPADPARMLLCANNEYFSPELMFPAIDDIRDFTSEHVEAAYAAMGVSVVEIEKRGRRWRARTTPAPGQGANRRITPFTPVKFAGPAASHRWIQAAAAIVNEKEPHRGPGESAPDEVRCGTMANCAGGFTPWGTYLSAEENFDTYFTGSENSDEQIEARRDPAYALDASSFGYPNNVYGMRGAPDQFKIKQNPHGPALYGWIVEIDPYDSSSTPRKRTALGRKKAECATTALTRDNRVAVYMGDDQRGEFVYKFVTSGHFDPANRAANMDLLDEGELYVAQFHEDGGGRWLKLELDAVHAAAAERDSPMRFADKGDLMMRARDAARLLGATPMDRPEDVEAVIDHNWVGQGQVLVVCTNNKEQGFERPGNPHRESDRPGRAQANLAGHILRIDEQGGDCGAERFSWDVFALGGDPQAESFTAPTRAGAPAYVSNRFKGEPTTSGDRFACPDNVCIDKNHNVWIATDGSDAVFADCNDQVMATSVSGDGPRPMKRFLVGPVGAEICGPLMAPDGRAFFCSIQHPGGNDSQGVDYATARWAGAKPPSSFPDGGESWPRSAVIVITREDGGPIGA